VLTALLSLTASLAWGTSNYLAGIESRRRSVWRVTALSQIAAAGVAGVPLLFTSQPPPGSWDTAVLVLAGVATAVGLVAFYRALAIGPMSIVSPIIAGEVMIPVAAGLITGERPGPPAYLGMALAVGGMVVLTWRRRGARDRVHLSAVLLAVLAAACWGFLLTAFGVSGHESPYWAVFDTRLVSAVVLAAYVVGTGRGLSLRTQHIPALVAIGLLLTAANILFTLATGSGDLSVVAILGSLSPVVVTAYAQVLLRERLTARQWAGFAVVFAGVVLLSL
jgi:drug/metabolite transporter (DMT)-like permease